MSDTIELIKKLRRMTGFSNNSDKMLREAANELSQLLASNEKLKRCILQQNKTHRGRKFEIMSLKGKVRYIQNLVRCVRHKRLKITLGKGFAAGVGIVVVIIVIILIMYYCG